MSGATPFTNVYRFISKKTDADVYGGINTWNAYAVDAAAGPNGGTLTPEFTLESFISGPGGIADDIATGGSFWYGIAYTYSNGVQVAGAVYREITIQPGTGRYTVSDWERTTTAPPLAVTEGDLTGAELGSDEPAVDSTVVPIKAGAGNANKTLNVAVFANGGARQNLGTVTLDAQGNGSVDVAGKGLGSAPAPGVAHKIFLYELEAGNDEKLVGWDAFSLVTSPPAPGTSVTSNLTAAVTGGSNRFELIAPASLSVDLGNARRNQTTAPVALGQFTVIDDRDAQLGWNVNTRVADFAGANNATIPATALGYKPVAAGGVQDGVTLGAAKPAGEGSFGILVSGAAGSGTTEEGARFNADLTFKVPVDAARGTYTSTLTLDLVSK